MPPIEVAVDRVVVPGPVGHDAAELRAGLARSLGPALAGRLGPAAVEQVVTQLSASIAHRGARRSGAPNAASRQGGGRHGA